MQSRNVRSRLDEIKSEVKDKLARPTLVDELTKQNEQQNEKKMGWVVKEIKDDPGGAFLLAISMLFTAMLGVYMGLTPHLAQDPNNPAAQVIAFDTDFGHVVTAIMYVLAFWTVTELAVFYSRHKYHVREEGNGHQLWTMWVAMGFGVIGIVVTGGAGGTVVASTLGFLSEFKSVPPSLQKYLVWIIPSLFGLYFVLHTVYRLSSQKAKAERIAQQTKDRQELEHRMILEQLEMDGEEEIMVEEIERYKELIRLGKLTRGQARAAMRAGKSIPELEKEMNKDLDDSGGIGDTKPSPILMKPPKALSQPSAHKIYTTDDLCRLWAKSREQVYDILATYNNANHFYSYSEARGGWLPEDMTRENFGDIYHELMVQFAKQQNDWNEVNRRLEEVKQDLLRAQDMLEPKDRNNGQNPH
jgi:hypothetical protein